MNAQLLLASASPRRRELLDQIAIRYQVCPVDIDETPRAGERPQDYVSRVAAEKSAACVERYCSNLPVLAADTSVVINGQILGKPQDEAHATAMLRLLSGQLHQVYTAVSVRVQESGTDSAQHSHYQVMSMTDVQFKKLSEAEIKAYWQTGEPKGKAGAYAIQGLASVFVESIKGSFSGVVGLPLFETAELLSRQGIRVLK